MALGCTTATAADRVIIQVDNANKGIVTALTKQLGGEVKVDADGFIAAQFNGKSVDEIKGILKNPHIKLIEEDLVRKPMALFNDDAGDPMQQQITPYAVYQSQANQVQFNPGAGIKVCVIDSGLDQSNPDFNWGSITGDNDSGTGNWNVNGGPHGTHVAGIVAARTNNAVGVAGTAGRATIVPLRFYGTGTGDIDRVKIPMSNTAGISLPVNIGATDFTIEFWLRFAPGENTSGSCAEGEDAWINGNIIFDRDIFGAPDYGDFGISLYGGRIAFGAHNGSSGYSICSGATLTANQWHHVAVTRRTNGEMRIFLNGNLSRSYSGPTGNVSYRVGRSVPWPNEPYLVIGAEKHDYDPSNYPSFSGWVDEVRISNVARYTTSFTPPSAPFTPDANTVGLYRFDEGSGTTVLDSSGASGGPSHGQRRVGGPNNGPNKIGSKSMVRSKPSSNAGSHPRSLSMSSPVFMPSAFAILDVLSFSYSSDVFSSLPSPSSSTFSADRRT